MEKQMKKITVETLPNGYRLSFDGMTHKGGYLYFTPEKLLEGFMLHIGLNITKAINTGTAQEFMKAVTNWNDNEKCIAEIDRLQQEVQKANGRRNGMAKRLIKERSRLCETTSFVTELASNNKSVKLPQNVKSYAKLKPYKLKELGINSDSIIDDDDDYDDI